MYMCVCVSGWKETTEQLRVVHPSCNGYVPVRWARRPKKQLSIEDRKDVQ